MDKGLKRPTRAAPETLDLELETDDAGRRVLVAYYPDRGTIPVRWRMVHPQLADFLKRSFVVHGYEHDRSTGQTFGQAWEIEWYRR